MDVDVVVGWHDWAGAAKWKSMKAIDFSKEYNQRYPANKIRRIQYDIEVYLEDRYKAGKRAEVLKEYIQLIDESVVKLQGSGIGLSPALPHFYDQAQNWTPSINYKGKNAYTFTHVLELLDNLENSSIILMSYRNFYNGSQRGIPGLKKVIQTEMAEAVGHNTKIIPAQETLPEHNLVTFYGKTKTELFANLDALKADYGNSSAYGGTAVHYLEFYMQLQD